MPKKKSVSPQSTKSLLEDISKRLKRVEKKTASLPRLEKELLANLKEEKVLEQEETDQLSELEKLEALEEEIKEDVKQNPIQKITLRDLSKSVVGAFFGVIGHFSFFYGLEIAEHISLARASLLYAVSLFIGFMFVYMTGFRKIQDKSWYFLPIRLSVIYFTSLVVIYFTLLIFDYISFASSLEHIYKTVASISILAVMGAATADLIGRDE